MRIALFSQKKRLPQETQRAVAPEKLLLPLLPSGPDGVHRAPLRETKAPQSDLEKNAVSMPAHALFLYADSIVNGSYYTMIQGSLTSVLLPCQVFGTIVTRLLDCPAQCT